MDKIRSTILGLLLGIRATRTGRSSSVGSAPTSMWTRQDARTAQEFLATAAGRKFRARLHSSISSHLPTANPQSYASPFDAGFNSGYSCAASDILQVLELLPSDSSLPETDNDNEQGD